MITKRRALLPLLILLVGFSLRLWFGADVEYKADEAYNFTVAQEIGKTRPWPWLGMNSSAGLENPGLSIWIFVALTRLFSAQDPVELSRSVQLLNCFALLLLVLFAAKRKEPHERQLWLYGAAIAAVNPMSVLLQRKLWAQSTLPVFSVLFIIAWFQRTNRWGAFFWGVVGALLGQIHMGGFYFSAAVFLWTLLFDKKHRPAWRFWFLGSALGALPLIPWILAMAHSVSENPSYLSWTRIWMLQFWNCWITGAWGTSIQYSVGEHFVELMAYPWIGLTPTYLCGVAQITLVASLVVLFAAWAWDARRGRVNWSSFLTGDGSSTDILIQSAFIGMGVLMTVSTFTIHHHYFLVIFPLQYLWLARFALRWGVRGQRLLWVIVLCQAFISAGFLSFIHANGGAPRGDFGVSYSRQLELQRN